MTYLDLPEHGVFYLLMVYAKNEKQDLTRTEIKDFKVLVDRIKKAHPRRWMKGNSL